MAKEPTTSEILEAINVFSNSVDKRFDGDDKSFCEFKSDINQRFNQIEATMVTKDYLDEKLADLRGDLVVLTRKEDTKLTSLVKILEQRKVISAKDAQKIMSLEPFAR